ncbi:MAG: hypothetical protein ACK4GD_05450 [Sphingomonadaceae bacterium]
MISSQATGYLRRQIICGWTIAVAIVSLVTAALAQTSSDPCNTSQPCAKPFLENGLYGIRNGYGVVTIAPAFSAAYLLMPRPVFGQGSFHGLIVTQRDGKFGFVNRRGIEVQAPQFDSYRVEHRSFLLVTKNGQNCLLDSEGKMRVHCDNHQILGAMFVTSVPGGAFQLVKDGKATFVRRSDGAPVKVTETGPPPLATRQASSSQTFNAARDWADRGDWGAAIRAAVSASDADKRYVLVKFHQAWVAHRSVLNQPVPATLATVQDRRLAARVQQERGLSFRYDGGFSALRDNAKLMEEAYTQASASERSAILALHRHAFPPAASLPTSPSSGRWPVFIDASTVGECHRRGGSVTIMGRCAR